MLEGLRASGLSNIQIAQRSHISRRSLWKIETGATRSPSLDSYLKLAEVYQRHVGPPPPLKLR